MGVASYSGLRFTTEDSSYSEKYWPEVTNLVRENYGTARITEAAQVQQILRHCFTYLCDCFMELLNSKKRASFFLFVNDLHEDSIEIWRLQLNGNQFPMDQGHFVLSRRIMKCILEQGCKLELQGHPNFVQETAERLQEYTVHLDELIYLGSMAMDISEHISRSKICPHSVAIEISGNDFTRLTFPPFNTLFTWWREDYSRHTSDVEVANDVILDFKAVLQSPLNVNYDHLCNFIFTQGQNPIERYGILRFQDLMLQMHRTYGYSMEFLNAFYGGLTISKSNVLDIEDCLIKTQNERRFMYRPILQYVIDGSTYCFIGANKWSESLTQLFTNCLPFSQFPSEWNQIQPLKQFFQRVMDNHDKILEDAAVNLLQNRAVIFDRTIKVIRKRDNHNLNIARLKNVGEIDLIFLDTDLKSIFVCECKHNRARYELHNWIEEMSKFRKQYEPQLERKCAWVHSNKIEVLAHLELENGVVIDEKEQYSIVPLFIINAPMLYMYDSDILVVTLHDLALLLDGNHQTVVFNGEFNNQSVQIQKPYFRNAERLSALAT